MADIKAKIESEKAIYQKRNSLEHDIKAYSAYVKQCRIRADKAAAETDFESEDQLRAEVETYKPVIKQLKKELAGTVSDPNGLRNEWTAYSIGYSRIFAKKYEEYKQARSSLAEQYKELIYMQREMLENRENILKLLPDELSEKVGTPKMMEVPIFDQRAKYNGFTTTTDIAFFASTGDIPSRMIDGATETMLLRRPVSEEYLHNCGYPVNTINGLPDCFVG